MTSLKFPSLLLAVVSLAFCRGASAARPRPRARPFAASSSIRPGARLPGVEIKVLREDTNETRRGGQRSPGALRLPGAGRRAVLDRSAPRRVHGLPASRRAAVGPGALARARADRHHDRGGDDWWGGIDGAAARDATRRRWPRSSIRTWWPTCRSTAATSSSWRCSRRARCRRRRDRRARCAATSRSARTAGREDFNNFILDGVYNIDPKLNTPGGAAAGRRHPRVRGGDVHLRCVVRTECRRPGERADAVGREHDHRQSAYEFFRDSALAAAQPLRARRTSPSPSTSRNQFGARDRRAARQEPHVLLRSTTSGRWLREGLTRVTNVPTAAGARRQLLAVGCSRRRAIRRAASRCRAAQLPPFFINPIGAAIAALYPLPNRDTPFANYVSSPVQRDDIHQFDAQGRSQLSTGTVRLTGAIQPVRSRV